MYLCGPDMLGDFVKVAVELREFRLHHISACGPPAGHQDDGLVLDIVHAKTDVPQLLEHTLITHNSDSFVFYMLSGVLRQSRADWRTAKQYRMS